MPQASTDGSGFVADRDAVPYEGGCHGHAGCGGCLACPLAHEAATFSSPVPSRHRLTCNASCHRLTCHACCVHTGHSEAVHKGLLKMWLAIEIEDHPGWFEWQQSAFELLQQHLLPLASLFFEYSKRGGSAAKSPTDGFTMSQREWVQFVKDCKIPIPITEINDVFRRVDRADKDEKKKDAKAKADKQMVLAEWLEALTRAAAKLMNTSKAGKQALKDGKLGEGFHKLITTYVLPLAVRRRPLRDARPCATLARATPAPARH